MTIAKTNHSNSFYTSKSFIKGNIFIIFFFSLLIIPSLIFFRVGVLNADSLYAKYSIDKDTFTTSYYKIGEIIIWSTVCITSLVVIFFNTLFYIASFKDELMHNHYGIKSYMFDIVSALFGLWIFGLSLIYTIIFVRDYSKFENLLVSTGKYVERNIGKKTLTVDAQFSLDLSKHFGEFIHDVEIYTICTMLIFIVIDCLSVLIKKMQIKNKPDEKLLYLQRSFASNQLWAIDIPVCVGILLINFFVSTIPEDSLNVFDSKFVFIAGGIGMHIIMSQIIFLFLNMKYRHEEYKIPH